MADKTTHFGRAGEYFAMSELLLRGWNVAVPVVDVGDDAFVIDDRDKTTHRVQVKAASAEQVAAGTKARAAGRILDLPEDVVRTGVGAHFNLSRQQLRTEQPIEIFYMLLVRSENRWRFLIIPREHLLDIRSAFVEPAGRRVGRPPVGDELARSDIVGLDVVIVAGAATGWGARLDDYLDRWPSELAIVHGGPGSTAGPMGPDATPPFAEAPPPSLDPGR